jgi:PhzF family phenazine biosynthesis protein
MIIYRYDAFSSVPNKGNPAGVVFEADALSETKMQAIAKVIGFNETAFILNSEIADIKVRFFTPGHEMNFCGHGTIATIVALKGKGFLEDKKTLNIETAAGVLPIKISYDESGEIVISSKLAPAEFSSFNGDVVALAKSMGIDKQDIDENFPIMYGSAGIWTLLVPIKKLETFKKMKPANISFPEILTELPRASVHPFCLETFDPKCQMHGRHFSSPFSGTKEDAVTGTASGLMAAYYAKYIKASEHISIEIEQGQEIGKDGRVKLEVNFIDGKYQVEMSGTAIYVKEIEVCI